MSDIFYPKAINVHDKQILEFVDCLHYELLPGHRFAYIYAWDKGTNGKLKDDSRPHAKIPGEYFLHVRRFLWRYYLFTTFLKFKKKLKLENTFVIFSQKMVVMLDTVLEQLVFSCFQMQEGHLEVNQRFPLFDLYLATEFVVGYHDPKSVNAWRQHPENTGQDLERIDPFQFDWNVYDEALGDLLSGAMLQYDVCEISQEMMPEILAAIGQWYDMPTKRLTKAEKQALKKNPLKALVNGSPGLGQLIVDYNCPISKGYETSEEMSDAEWEIDVAGKEKETVPSLGSRQSPQKPTTLSKKTAKTTPEAKSTTPECNAGAAKTVEKAKSNTPECNAVASTTREQLYPDSQPPPPNQQELYGRTSAFNDPGSQLLSSARMMSTGNIE